jgi:hypothetical protein
MFYFPRITVATRRFYNKVHILLKSAILNVFLVLSVIHSYDALNTLCGTNIVVLVPYGPFGHIYQRL